MRVRRPAAPARDGAALFSEPVRPLFARVREMVRRIPRGNVATYGQVASLCEHPHSARTVGWALHGLTDAEADPECPDSVPWWRVINAEGRISLRCWGSSAGRQRDLLEGEGVAFSPEGQVDLGRFRWEPFCVTAE